MAERSDTFMEGYVYFIGNREHDLVKIGFTGGDPKRRLNALQTSCPYKLEILLVVDGDPQWERSFHTFCAESRLHGEWFRLSGRAEDIMEAFRFFYQAVDGTDGSVRYVA